jgi:hypothetical protein
MENRAGLPISSINTGGEVFKGYAGLERRRTAIWFCGFVKVERRLYAAQVTLSKL